LTITLIEPLRSEATRGRSSLSEHLTDPQLKSFQQRALPAADLLAWDEHLAACAECRQRLNAVCAGDASFAALQAEVLAETPTVHLDFEQLADLIEGRLNVEATQSANDHLAVCPQCRFAADDLRGFRLAVAENLHQVWQPQTQPAATPSRWQSAKAFFSTPWSLGLGTAAALVLLIGAAWLVRRAFFQPVLPQVVVIEATPTTTPTASATVMPESTQSNLLAQLNDGGGRLALNEQGVLLGADNLSASYQALLKQALTAPHVQRSPNLSDLGSPAAALMSGNTGEEAFTLRAPVAKVLLTDQPELQWQALAGAASYEVEIVDENFNAVANSGPLTTTAWRIASPLPRGRVYAWQVTAFKDGQAFKAPQPPAPLARFRVIAQKDFAEIQVVKARYPSSHLLLGQLYAQAGLLDEAEREFRALQKANPTAALPKKLLAEVRQHVAR
jgi:anti-sigma factor RsiW